VRGQGTGRLASLLAQGVGCFWAQLFVPWEIFLVQEIICALYITRFQEFHKIFNVSFRGTVLLRFSELLIAARRQHIIVFVELKTINFSDGPPAVLAGLLLE
jgi:hypothetical protein